jgi:nifR3 family TIM-barrel protein
MVSTDALAHGSEATMNLLHFDSSERPIGIQLFGSKPEHFKRSAAIVAERFTPDFIDLNAGCPVPKVTRKNGGASLLKNLEQFKKIIEAIVNTVSLPVTAKLRSGWHKYQWVDSEFAQCAEDCGVAAVTVHPRSQTMGFSGHSFWERIAAVKDTVSIPVIGNGDINSGSDALTMIRQTGCNGVMIGRGALGNPWIFSEVKAVLCGNTAPEPSLAEKRTTVLRHIARYRERYGEYRAGREMKKHMAWYLKGMSGASRLRDRIFRATSSSDFEKVVNEVFIT